MKKIFLVLMTFYVVSLLFSFSSAYNFNGTVYNISGVALNNTVVNVSIRALDFTVIGSNSSTTNASGAFNFNVTDNTTWLYQTSVTYSQDGAVQFIGQNLPFFDYYMATQLSGISFYLRPAGTINITAYNASWAPTMFQYKIIDTQLGFPISDGFTSYVSNVVVTVPRDRNYSIMIFPNQSLPVFFDWTNFSSPNSYNMSSISKYSNYNITTRTLHKEFNTSMSMSRVTGYFKNMTNPIEGWNSLSIVPYLLEPGNAVFIDNGDMPYNMSAFWQMMGQANQTGDFYNISGAGVGYFNITLPAPAEGANYLFFGAALNGSHYYGGYVNLTNLSYGASGRTVNISLYGLTGNRENISMNSANNWQEVNITTLRKSVTLLNASNVSLSGLSANVETTLDYSSYGSMEFTLVSDINQDKSANFSLPLLNVTGIKEINIYTQQYAPRRASFTTAQVNSALNVTLKSFTPGEIDGSIASSNLFMALYYSNASCDVPNPTRACQIGSTENMQDSNPMKSIMGGGKVSFRMGTGNISVHYVNVDMLASGPPDALFDDSTTNGSSGDSFSAALRFGSGGPDIYDFILVAFPYSDASGGLNENSSVNISVKYFYDDNWQLIWNSTVNGTDASALAGNFSHYSLFQNDWQVLMNANNTCGSNQTLVASAPCFINKSENKIWLRIPQFSGTGPSVTGSVVSAISSSSSSSSSSSATAEGGKTEDDKVILDEGEEVIQQAPEEIVYDPGVESFDDFGDWVESGTHSVDAEEGSMYTFTFISSDYQEEEHFITVQDVNIEQSSVTLLIQSEPQEIILFLGTGREVDLNADGENDLLIVLDSLSSEGIASLQFSKLDTWIEREQGDVESVEEVSSGSSVWLLVGALLLFVVTVLLLYFSFIRTKNKG